MLGVDTFTCSSRCAGYSIILGIVMRWKDARVVSEMPKVKLAFTFGGRCADLRRGERLLRSRLGSWSGRGGGPRWHYWHGVRGRGK